MGFSRKRKTSPSENADDEVVTKKTKAVGPPEKKEGEDGNPYWELSGKRRIQVSEFKGMTMVNIREFYEKDGKALPGKAGINMPVDQFLTLLSSLPQILDELEGRGIEIERPNLVGQPADGEQSKHFGEEKKKAKKSNIEATSDEAEDD